jgi:hypothetical protein
VEVLSVTSTREIRPNKTLHLTGPAFWFFEVYGPAAGPAAERGVRPREVTVEVRGAAMKFWIALELASLLIISVAIGVAIIALWPCSDAVQPDDLAKLIDRADKLIVLQGPWDDCPVLFESSDRRDLDALKTAVRVVHPQQFVHCSCDGKPAIYLYANGQKIGQITNHHAKLVRCSLWKSDMLLTDGEAFLKWFDDRNIPGPRKEYQAELAWRMKREENAWKWVEAMPPALRPHWADAAQRWQEPDLAPLRTALASDLPDKHSRIRALYSWYGSGAGPWSGYPGYEDIARQMLMDYSTADLLAAIEGEELTAAETEGVARLFGGGPPLSSYRPNDLHLLPAELKARLLKHSLASTDQDKLSRARRAFGRE